MNESRSMQSPPRSSNQRLGQPLGGTSGHWRHRFFRFHVPLILASAVVLFLWMSLPLFQTASHQSPQQAGTQAPSHQNPQQAADVVPMEQQNGHQTGNIDARQDRAFIARFTTATGYVALGLLTLTLLIGPANLLLRRHNPISTYLRRDVGIWTAITSVIHVIAGFQVHGPPAPLSERIMHYFFASDGSLLTNPFGLGNWTGLAATVIVVGLFALSSNFALRKLKAGPWKSLQRLNYALFVLVIAHAIFYGAWLRVTSPSTLLLGLCVIAVIAGQVLGIWLWCRRQARPTARQPV